MLIRKCYIERTYSTKRILDHINRQPNKMKQDLVKGVNLFQISIF